MVGSKPTILFYHFALKSIYHFKFKKLSFYFVPYNYTMKKKE